MPHSPLLGMHAPDGFLEPPVAAAAAVISLVVIAVALRRSATELGDRQVPLAGMTAAFVFAAQMVNFPVAAGTSGHLVGAALAAVLLGPWTAVLALTVVVVVQALVFADGGITALGINLVNLAIVPAFGGWAVFRLARRSLPRTSSGVVGATAIAAGVSVVLSAAAFSLQWLFGASAPVPFDTVFGAMVGVHTLIGLGEAAISATVVAAVLATRPDLVAGASDLEPHRINRHAPVGARTFVIGAGLTTVFVAVAVSQFASSSPDGLERVAEDHGFAERARTHAFDNGWFADYATSGVSNESLSLAVAGLSGVALTLLVGYGIVSASRRAGSSLARR